jgi:predicted aldo/keto reductase-like oxidoreductase
LPADWALQWLWNQPEVSLVLSGMSAMGHVRENVASAKASGTNTLTEEELALVGQVRDKYQELCPIPCTQCEYCLPCPNGVNIPRNFEAYNQGLMYDKADQSRWAYNSFIPEEERASECLQCYECEEKCPQSIPISYWMPTVHEVLGEGRAYVASL